ncbi:radical SAM protein [Candidatus Bathycorpusculum sp.]|uniref:radical SAM/SPASM domain-containing protein n=1 Tax=Candidatus Bathycorpusculum sp. TaxID=2994959 RepID=UPI002838FE83|nr:radical SAM protein [Candidatus Termitimicrobium sp.]MCL2686088.1 radical SAM protein [Candidatus Termitimicrobium sp.]
MLNVTKLWCNLPGSMDHIRYGPTTHKKPIVVWNTTRRCNLSCVHCYSKSEDKPYQNELTTQEAKTFVEDLASFKVPVLLFSGGEPLLRHDLFEIATYASNLGIRTVLSTNGTLITPEKAQKLKTAGFSYIGVSLDGAEETNNKFRGSPTAFQQAITGIRNCLQAGLKPGLRFTVTNYNIQDIDKIFDLIETENIPRACFYHLAYVGRGTSIVNDDLTPKQTRDFMDYLLSKVEANRQKAKNTEILTVDNHTDAAYLYLKLNQKNPQQAQEVLNLLKINGGNSSGKGIACVDFNGNVHPDQFWQHHSIGNIREQKFSTLWAETQDPLLIALRNRTSHLKGKCAQCQFLNICNGNLRVRAEAVYDDVWAPDPACYLTDEETTVK